MERVVYIHHVPAPTTFDQDPAPLKCVCLCGRPNRDVWKTLHTSDVIIYPQAHAPSCECASTQSHTHTKVGTVYTPLKRHRFFFPGCYLKGSFLSRSTFRARKIGKSVNNIFQKKNMFSPLLCIFLWPTTTCCCQCMGNSGLFTWKCSHSYRQTHGELLPDSPYVYKAFVSFYSWCHLLLWFTCLIALIALCLAATDSCFQWKTPKNVPHTTCSASTGPAVSNLLHNRNKR